METFLACLKAEIRKARRSFAVWLTLTGTVANLVIFFVLHYFSNDWPIAYDNPWKGFIAGHYEGIAFMMLPLYVIILCTLVTFLEHRHHMWVQLYTLPFSPWAVYSSKLFFTLLLFVGAHFLFIGGLLLTGLLMGLLRPATGLLGQAPDLFQIAVLAFQTLWTILGLLALHFWLSWRFPQFIVPLLIGILGFVLVSVLGPAWPGNAFIPYAYPIQYMPAYRGEIELGAWWGMPPYFWLSPLYFLIFMLLGYFSSTRSAPRQ